MERRDLLLLGAGVAVGGTALGGLLTLRTQRRIQRRDDALACLSAPPEDPPDAVYLPTHLDGMETVDTVEGDDYAVTVAYTYPHPFWTLAGSRVERVDSSGDLHMMFVVRDAETRRALPVDSGPSLRISRDGETLVDGGTWPMLSQQMGVHFGDNVAVDGSGAVDVEVEVPALDVALVGGYEGRFQESERFDLSFDFTPSELDDLECVDVGRTGERGAVGPHTLQQVLEERAAEEGTGEGGDDAGDGHGHAVSRAPAAEDIPGRLLGVESSGDADVAVTLDDDRLVVSPRAPYNRYPLPMASLSAEVVRDGERVFEGALRPRLGSDAGHHYHAVPRASVEEGDDVVVSFDAPPQVARHMGYETAFVEMPDVEVSV